MISMNIWEEINGKAECKMGVENLPYHINTFSKGINASDDPELVGAVPSNGEFIDGRNQRSAASSSGHSGSSEKIKGEQLLYQRNVTGAYKCNGAITVNGDIVEFWSSPTGGQTPFVRVNGVVVLKSVLFPITYNIPLQLDRNEAEEGGEVFFTDNVSPAPGVVGTPMILNVQDMVTSLVTNPNKYFSAFDPKLYNINLFIPLDMPVFAETVNVGGGGGLPVGSYSYQIRYSNSEGDKTNLSQRTPLIPIVENLSNLPPNTAGATPSDYMYPGGHTYGKHSDSAFGTRFGIKIRFRVTNLQGYEFIQVIRTAYNTNGGINFVPAPTIIADIAISPNQISVIEFIDPIESNTTEVLSDSTVSQQITFINAAKGIRYFDRRLVLMNVELASKVSTLTYKTLNGKTMFPVVEPIGVIGHKDAWNFTYRKAYMHGDRTSYAVQLYDGVGGKGFASKVIGGSNYYMPNRRDVTSNETNLYSYNVNDAGGIGCVQTLNVNNQLTRTFEVFDTFNCQSKSDFCSFKNIYHNKTASSLLGVKLISTVQEDCDENNGEISSHGVNIYLVNHVSPAYHVFTPVSQNDSSVSGWNYVINTSVCTDGELAPGFPFHPVNSDNVYSSQPSLFAPNYYSQGMALTGIDNIPNWVKAFSVVQTPPAKRVIAQGICMYRLNPAQFNPLIPDTATALATKENDVFWFFSPDMENGIVNGKLIDDIIASPEGYQLQFVAPLGFASEVYSFDANDSPTSFYRDRSVDIISYARMMRDDCSSPTSSKVNKGESYNMGFDGGDGYRYVGYARWRNTTAESHIFGDVANGYDGNRLITIKKVERIREGRGNYMQVTIDATPGTTFGDLYWNRDTGRSGSNNFGDEGMQNFTEPFYMVNIVADGEIVRDQNIENYKVTTHYQKLESIIGEGDGTNNQKFQLVDERWEDCIPAPFSTHSTASTPRYIYIKNPTLNITKKWVNVTYLSGANRATIANAISTSGSYTGIFGTGVQGMYTHENVDSNFRFWNIIFNVSGFTIPQGSLVMVRYDNTAPIRFWGGDTTVGESIFAPIDREASANLIGSTSLFNNKVAPDTQFPFGIGFPYRLWKVNPRVYQVKRTTGAVNVIQDRNWGFLGYIRQMCVMFTVESRIATPYAHSLDYPLQFFPSVNYVMRPLRWDADLSVAGNNIIPQYINDYGESEKDNWKYGGFRFLQNINPDYSTTAPKEFVSKPEFGFVEKTRFYTRVMWSLPRQVNQQNTPGLKTFPANNAFDIDDNSGEIKKAYSSTTDKGVNIYAITESGICLLVTKKSILSDLNAGQLGYMSADTFVKEQYWIEREVGMSDEMWRASVEAYVNMTLQDGSETRVEGLFFINKESAFRFMDNNLKDIGRINYHNKLYRSLQAIEPGFQTQISAVYDKYHEEYMINIQSVNKTEVFSQKNNSWNGYYDYTFDIMISENNNTYGLRNVETYEMGKGFLINGEAIQYQITAAASPKEFVDKEFVRIRINTGENVKPSVVYFYDRVGGDLLCYLDISKGSQYLKMYRGWEQWIPRKDFVRDTARGRVQGRILVYTISHNTMEDFRIIDSGIMYKQII